MGVTVKSDSQSFVIIKGDTGHKTLNSIMDLVNIMCVSHYHYQGLAGKIRKSGSKTMIVML